MTEPHATGDSQGIDDSTFPESTSASSEDNTSDQSSASTPGHDAEDVSTNPLSTSEVHDYIASGIFAYIPGVAVVRDQDEWIKASSNPHQQWIIVLESIILDPLPTNEHTQIAIVAETSLPTGRFYNLFGAGNYVLNFSSQTVVRSFNRVNIVVQAGSHPDTEIFLHDWATCEAYAGQIFAQGESNVVAYPGTELFAREACHIKLNYSKAHHDEIEKQLNQEFRDGRKENPTFELDDDYISERYKAALPQLTIQSTAANIIYRDMESGTESDKAPRILKDHTETDFYRFNPQTQKSELRPPNTLPFDPAYEPYLTDVPAAHLFEGNIGERDIDRFDHFYESELVKLVTEAETLAQSDDLKAAALRFEALQTEYRVLQEEWDKNQPDRGDLKFGPEIKTWRDWRERSIERFKSAQEVFITRYDQFVTKAAGKDESEMMPERTKEQERLRRIRDSR